MTWRKLLSEIINNVGDLDGEAVVRINQRDENYCIIGQKTAPVNRITMVIGLSKNGISIEESEIKQDSIYW